MRAVQITRFDGPETMDVVDLPGPAPAFPTDDLAPRCGIVRMSRRRCPEMLLAMASSRSRRP